MLWSEARETLVRASIALLQLGLPAAARRSSHPSGKLGHEPALAPYQQIYRQLIRKAVADASAVASAEIEAKGPEAGLDDAMGRMVVMAEADDTLDRLKSSRARRNRRRHR